MTRPPAFLKKREQTGAGVSNALSDRAFWLDPATLNGDLLHALLKIDHKNDKSQLLTLLRSEDFKMTRTERWYLADLLERHELKKPRGRPRSPAYERSSSEALLELGVMRANELRAENRKLKVRDALVLAAQDFSISETALAAFYDGRRGDRRRKAKRRP